MKTINLGPVSAYALAKKNGYTGTEQEWLESLKGSSVTDEQVSSAVDTYLEEHPELTTVQDGSISEAKLAQDVKNKFDALSEDIVDLENKALFETDASLTLKDGVLSVNTTNDAEKDNTLPITSAGVYAQVGNIDILLKTI